MQHFDYQTFQEKNAPYVICNDTFDVTQTKFVAGVDISFGVDPNACGHITVLDFKTLNVVYEDYLNVVLSVPYVSGFLAFREVPVYVALLDKLKQTKPEYYPDIVIVDGSGILHHRCFGSASHLGVIYDIPTIGCAKTLLSVDGLNEKDVKAQAKLLQKKGDTIQLTGQSGKIYGVALKSSDKSTNPIYISIGHKISLESAVKIITQLCIYRIPEPIRNSDIKSKLFIL